MFRLVNPCFLQFAVRPLVSRYRLAQPVAFFSNGKKRNAAMPKTKSQKPVSSKKAPNKYTKQDVAALLKDIDITSQEMSETEAKKLQELDKILSESPELKNMSMEEIIGMLNLSEEDNNQLKSQIADVMNSGDINSINQDLSKQFPGIDPALQNIMNEMEKEFNKTPGLRSEFQSWMNMIQRELGPNLEKADSMTEEEINRISLPPPRLREVMDRLIPDTNMFNTMNLDEGISFNLGGNGGTKVDINKTVEEKDEAGQPIAIEEIPITK